MATQRDLGQKFTCFKCVCKFYDMNQPEPLCPRCGADQRENPNPDPREAFLARYRRPPSRKASKAKAKAEPAKAELKDDDDDDLLDDLDGDDGDDGKGKKAEAAKK